jgi:hypothetical protein
MTSIESREKWLRRSDCQGGGSRGRVETEGKGGIPKKNRGAATTESPVSIVLMIYNTSAREI